MGLRDGLLAVLGQHLSPKQKEAEVTMVQRRLLPPELGRTGKLGSKLQSLPRCRSQAAALYEAARGAPTLWPSADLLATLGEGVAFLAMTVGWGKGKGDYSEALNSAH